MMSMNIRKAQKDTEQIIQHYSNLRTSTLATRDQAIAAIKGYQGFLADLHQEIKDADQFAYSRREGSAVQGKAVDRSIALEDCRQAILAARKALMEHFNICGSCFGQGQEGGWTCPNCAGSTHEPSTEARYVCAWCRNRFAPSTEAQTYCVNCQKHAPSAKAAGLSEMEWRKIAVQNVGTYRDGHPLTNYVPRFCKQYECSACGGTGSFVSYDGHTPFRSQCGYCYPAAKPPAVLCTRCRAPFTPTEDRDLLCVSCAEEVAMAQHDFQVMTGVQPSKKSATAATVKHNRFARGTGRYTCAACSKGTRDTGNGEAEVGLCLKCFEECSLENEHSDYGHPQPVAGCPTCRYEAEHIDPVVPTPKELTSFGDFWGTNRTEQQKKEGEAVVVTEDDWAAEGSPLVAHLKAELGTGPSFEDQLARDAATDDRYWADEGRVDQPAISVAWNGQEIRIIGPDASYTGIPDDIPTGDKAYRINGWQFDWLGVVPSGQAYRAVMISTGEVLGTFSTDQECAEFIYTTLQAGLTATTYAEPEAPATVPAQPQLPDRANQFIARLEAVEAKLDRVLGLLDPVAVLFLAERTALEAQVLAHGEAIGENTGAVMQLRDLIAELIPSVKAANVTIGPKPTDAQATALEAVERAVEAAQADPTEPCTAFGCKKGMIALGQKCPACKGTGRVQKRAVCWGCQAELTCARCFEKIYQPVPLQCPQCKASTICADCYTYQGQSCTECTKIFAPDDVHRTICPECRAKEAAQQAEPSTEPEEEAAPSYTAEQMIAMFADPNHGRNWVEWAVWVLGNRQTEEELSAGGTLYENGVGFNGADGAYGTSLFGWLSNHRNQQPHLTANQITAAARMLKKYVSTQLLPALQYSCPHIPSSFKKGDWVEVTTWQDGKARQIIAHDWLYVYFDQGAQPARWYDCVAVKAPQQATEAPEDGLEDLEL